MLQISHGLVQLGRNCATNVGEGLSKLPSLVQVQSVCPHSLPVPPYLLCSNEKNQRLVSLGLWASPQ